MHPRCARHWQALIELIRKFVQSAGSTDVGWSRGRTKGSLALTLEIRPKNPGRIDLYEQFGDRMRRTTPELEELGPRDDSPR